jgi:hypothetical protein
MEFITKAQAKRLTGLSYLGSVSTTVKHKKSKKYGELTYSLYLAPAKSSGYEVCNGRTAECTRLCLNESGMNTMVRNDKGDMINRSRIIKTRLFFEDREFFMKWLIFEINAGITKAKKMGFAFSVRLNNTSDISPEEFQLNGKNILQIFSDVKFYEYTKVAARVDLMKIYNNYDVTFSYSGYNLTECQKMLLNKIRIAVVFKNIPETYMGHKVINGDLYDMRYKDAEDIIIGLKYKRVRQKLTSDIKFVIQ